MKKRPSLYFHFLFFLLLCTAARAQFLNLDWARQTGAVGAASYGTGIATDTAGNVYTTGFFYGTVDFDPGSATFNLVSATNFDTYISKFDPSGNLVWAKRLGNAGSDHGTAIAVDKAGSIYVTGIFNDTIDVDPGPSTYFLYAPFIVSSSTFLLKLNPAGNFVWARQWGGSAGSCTGHAVRVDSLQNIYMTGSIIGPYIDLDPGSSTQMISTWQYGNGGWAEASIIVKLDSAGNLVWVEADTRDEINSHTDVDAGGNIASIKHRQWIGTLSSSSSFYLERLSPERQLLWSRKFAADANLYNYGVATDQAHNVYASGFFYKTADFDPGPGVVNLQADSKIAGTTSLFIVKLNAAGEFVWVKQVNNLPYSDIRNMTDAEGNVYVSGMFSGTVDFDPGPDLFRLTAAPLNSFILKLSPSGKFLWAQQFGKGAVETIAGWCMDTAGSIYATGTFTGTCNFNTGSGAELTYSCQGYNDAFTSKMKASGLLAVKDMLSYPAILFPNPASSMVNIVMEEDLEQPVIRLTDLAGRLITETSYSKDYAFQLDLSALAGGVYILTVHDGLHRVFTGRVVKE